MTSLWKVVVPEAARNWVLNPSAEGSVNGTALGAATITLDTTYAFRGRRSYKVVTTAGAGDDGIRLSLKTLENTAYYTTFWIYGSLPATFVCALSGSGTYRTPTLLNTEGNWYQYGYAHAAGDANTSAYVDIRQTTAAAKTFYIDCMQVEQADHWTTYVDGDQPGCKWEGGRHASASVRFASSRAGGRVRDFADTYSAYVAEGPQGLGSPTKEHLLEPRALVDGSVYQGTRASERVMQLTVGIQGTSLADLYSKRKAFLSAVGRYAAYPAQPTLFYYTGAGKTAVARALVEGGDEGMGVTGFYEDMPLRLLAADDVFWEELAEQSATLSNSTTLAVEQMVAYRPSQTWSATTGYWDALGAPELTAGAVDQRINCFAKDKLGNLYVGGDFTNLNGIANADYIAKRDKDGVWGALGTGTGGIVYAMALDEAGDLYVGGDFTNLTDANGDYITKWTAGAFASLAGGASGIVRSIRVAKNGLVYVGGEFAHVHSAVPADVANTSGIAKWTPGTSTWSALGTGVTLTDALDGVYAIVEDASGNLYCGGVFTNAGGVAAADYIGKWTGAWASVGVFDGKVSDIAISPVTGRIYAVGTFANVDSVVTYGAVSSPDGLKWAKMGAGINATCYKVAVSPSGVVYVSCNLSTADGFLMWNGTSLIAAPFKFPSTDQPQALLADGNDLYVGFTTEGSATVYGIDTATGTVTCSGTAPCYPVITIACTVATATLQEVRNASTGHVIRFNRPMLVGETITIDTRPGLESVRSDFPPPSGANVTMLMPSDLGNFRLMPGANYISVYAPGAGATVTTHMWWRVKHDGVEGAAT